MRNKVITVAAVAGLGLVGVGGVAVAATMGTDDGAQDTPTGPAVAGNAGGAGDEDSDDGPGDGPGESDGTTPPGGLPALPDDLLDHLPDDLAEQLPEDLAERLPEDLAEQLPDDLAAQLPDDLAAQLPEDLAGSADVEALTDAMQPMIDAALEGLELLDLSPFELLGELSNGATIGELATEQGVDPEDLVQLGLEPVDEQLDAAVVDGEIDRTEADATRAELESMLRTVIEEGPEAVGLPTPTA
ncbi:hypothetical protein [Georgenia sp. Z1491]|uniref:hypothetical protein n=1 Tax=Georgenia sp. Z1491 TaxID=3416707 RepID=UPI003CEA1596